MTYDRELRTEAAHALTHNSEVWADRGYAVVTAGGLSAGDTDFELDVGPYDVLVGSTDIASVGPTTLSVNAPAENPYWLVVYADSAGLQTEQGPEGEVFVGDQSVVASNADVREITSPAPPTLADIGPVTVLGKVLVTSSGVTDSLIDDRTFGGERVLRAPDLTLRSDTVEQDDIQTDAVGSDEIQTDAVGSAEIQTDAVSVDELNEPSFVVARPDRLPLAALDDGESYEISVRVADGETLEVYRWGAYDAADGTAPAGLDVELLDGSDTVQVSANTANTQDSAAPVASHANTSGTLSVFKLRALNGTGATIDSPGVGAHFGFRVI